MKVKKHTANGDQAFLKSAPAVATVAVNHDDLLERVLQPESAFLTRVRRLFMSLLVVSSYVILAHSFEGLSTTRTLKHRTRQSHGIIERGLIVRGFAHVDRNAVNVHCFLTQLSWWPIGDLECAVCHAEAVNVLRALAFDDPTDHVSKQVCLPFLKPFSSLVVLWRLTVWLFVDPVWIGVVGRGVNSLEDWVAHC